MKKSSVFDQRTSALKKIVKGRKAEAQSSAATVESATPTHLHGGRPLKVSLMRRKLNCVN